MRDITLNSNIIRLKDLPEATTKIMIMYDERGWAIRCYDDSGVNNKLTTMIPDDKYGDTGSDITLVPKEQL